MPKKCLIFCRTFCHDNNKHALLLPCSRWFDATQQAQLAASSFFFSASWQLEKPTSL
jgi:hypothetical protein|tara:strand:- start:279 stop:449 length:171 start_codon:yes stop_codon:yes gene_type:complete